MINIGGQLAGLCGSCLSRVLTSRPQPSGVARVKRIASSRKIRPRPASVCTLVRMRTTAFPCNVPSAGASILHTLL